MFVGATIHVCCIDSVAVLFKRLPASCSFRFDEAVSKYEAVMKTEPNVHHFSLLAKERMCHALAQVRPLSAATRCINSLFDFNQCVFFFCVS